MITDSSPSRICVTLDDTDALEEAIGFALSTWTDQLQVGERLAWEQYAVAAHAIRNELAHAAREADCRWFVLRPDSAMALHGVGRTCEAKHAIPSTLALIARRYADRAAAGEPICRVASAGYDASVSA